MMMMDNTASPKPMPFFFALLEALFLTTALSIPITLTVLGRLFTRSSRFGCNLQSLFVLSQSNISPSPVLPSPLFSSITPYTFYSKLMLSPSSHSTYDGPVPLQSLLHPGVQL